jgi:myo-inositol-1(or 4)-monophosphatase
MARRIAAVGRVTVSERRSTQSVAVMGCHYAVVHDLSALLDVATALAREAADLLVDSLGRARTDVGTKSSATDMVTEMDRASELLIVTGLRAARPDDAVVGEEGTADGGSTGVRWLIDPIDGTTNFLYGHPGFAVSIAAEVDGEVAVGVVADPLHHDLFTATKGGGAHRNGQLLRIGEPPPLATSLLATGFSYDPGRRRRQSEVLTEVLPWVRDIRRMGAAAVDLCSVACGRVDAYYEKGLQAWDYAAGALVAAEAGARVGDLDGGPPSPAFTMVAHPLRYDELAALLDRAGAREA